jgi:hypothetical protein
MFLTTEIFRSIVMLTAIMFSIVMLRVILMRVDNLNVAECLYVQFCHTECSFF